MTKFRTLLAAALITLPVLTLDAALSPDQTQTQPQVTSSSQAAEGCCWVFFLGRWWCVLCY